MKVLKIVGGLIAVLVLIVVVLGIIAPNSYSVERTIVIDAPPNMVFEYISHWENFSEWSPWSKQDTSIQSTIEGEDGTVGSVYRWEGDPELSGSGSMTNTGMEPGTRLDYHLQFIVPWESEADGYYKVTPVDGNKSKVAWGFHGKMPFPMNIFLLIQSMEETMSPDFDMGLQRLKMILEQKAAETEAQNKTITS